MLARPEINSAEHILLWLASKPPQQRYRWPNRHSCACGQYWAKHVDAEHPGSWALRGSEALRLLNDIAFACRPHTFGALHEAFAQAMQADPQMREGD